MQRANEYQTWLDEGNKKECVGDPCTWCQKEEYSSQPTLLEGNGGIAFTHCLEELNVRRPITI